MNFSSIYHIFISVVFENLMLYKQTISENTTPFITGQVYILEEAATLTLYAESGKFLHSM